MTKERCTHGNDPARCWRIPCIEARNERVCRSCDMPVTACLCEMPALGYDMQTRPVGDHVPIVVDLREANVLEGLVWGRLITAEANAGEMSEVPPEHQAREAAEVPMLRTLLERIRYIQRQLERQEVQR